ncbi:MAG: hypothetical protein KKH02_05405 [Proteobacteria bacterium]|nr:hypothetical protein [Pseudomonadota bacterium]MBU4581841.1 hypothetical protein [Pseudomonadota bacterium]MCG2741870.1 hypothetical protein [Syntrophaceae bacterium]
MIADVAALFLTGLVSLFGQIVLLRELNVAFYGIELIYLIALGVWMLLTAVGALIGGSRPSAGRTAVLFLCFALFLPLGIVFLRASRLLLGGIPGAYLPFPLQMAALVIALLPAGLLSGLLFRGRPPVSMLNVAGRWQAPTGSKVRVGSPGGCWRRSVSGTASRTSLSPSSAA